MSRFLRPLLVLAVTLAAAPAAVAQEVQPRLIAGSDAAVGEVPYQALVQVSFGGGTSMCGGSVLDENHVVTAAHCVLGDSELPSIVAPSRIDVSTGGINRDTGDGDLNGDDMDERSVTRVTVDRRYARDLLGDAHDSAVLTLSAPLDLSGSETKAIPLATPGETAAAFSAAVGDRPTVSGWGVTDPQDSGSTSESLQKAQVPLVTDADCDDDYPDLVPDAMLCAGSRASASFVPDTCQGDSGGPLALDTQLGAGKTPKLAGITSFGIFCGVRPGVYTEVAEATTTSLLSNPPTVDPPEPAGTATVSGTLREGASVTCNAPSLASATPTYVWVLVEGSDLYLLPGSAASITLPEGTAGESVFCGRRYESDGGFAYLQSADAGPIAAAPTGGGGAAPTFPTLPSFPTTQLQSLSDVGFGGFPGRRTSLRRVLRRGLAGRISCNADCGFRAELVLPRRSARKARIRGRVAVVSRVRASDAAGGSGRGIRFRFSRRTAAKLRRLTRGTAIEVRVTARDASGTRRVEKKKLRLKR